MCVYPNAEIKFEQFLYVTLMLHILKWIIVIYQWELYMIWVSNKKGIYNLCNILYCQTFFFQKRTSNLNSQRVGHDSLHFYFVKPGLNDINFI